MGYLFKTQYTFITDYFSIIEKITVNTIHNMRISPRYLILKEASSRSYDSLYALVHIQMDIHLWANSLQPHACSLPGSSIHRILQARILEWVAISSSRGLNPHLLRFLYLQAGSLPLAPSGRVFLSKCKAFYLVRF